MRNAVPAGRQEIELVVAPSGGEKKTLWVFLTSCFLLAVLLLPVISAKADGGIMPRPNYYANETTQKAFIFFQNQTENLVISTSYQGNSADFAWIIPTPTKPEIAKSSAKLFTTLQKITKTNDSGPIISQSGFSLNDASKSSSVEVIDEKTVDIYDTVTLKATDDKVLSNWLNDHGYTFPSEKSPALKSYVDNNWYFVVAKIQVSAVGSTEVKNQLATGTLTPLRLTFATDKIIYPMKLTGLALEYAMENSKKLGVATPSSNIPIVLYVLSNSKTSQDSLTTSWANWIDISEIKDLNDGGSWIKSDNKLFLTRMADTIKVKNMSDDFVIESTTNNDIYPTPVYKTSGFWLTNLLALVIAILIAVLSPLGLIFVIIVILQRFAIKRKAVYIFASIYQILYCLAVVFVWLMVYSVSGDQPFLSESGVAGITLGLLLVLAAAIFLIIKMLKQHKNRIKQEESK